MNRVVIVTGSRDHEDRRLIASALEEAQPTLVVHGGCRGADLIACAWAKDNGIPTKEFNADWNTHGRRAGPLRNEAMLRAHPDALVLGFPIGRSVGTRGCLRLAGELQMPTRVYE